MVVVALLIPLCSRGQGYAELESTPFFTQFYPSFERTKSSGYTYRIYLGYDEDDEFYRQHHAQLADKFRVSVLTGCQHAPARAWNQLCARAYEEGAEYFFQCGDDIVLETPNWTERFITELEEHQGIGVVGPCDPHNHWARVQMNRRIIVEISFVSRKHYEIHGSYFHPEIRNWYCDDWISEIYRGFHFCIFTDIIARNTNRRERYVIDHCPEFPRCLEEGIAKIKSYLASLS